MSYKSFAGFYDNFTKDVEYPKRADYILSLFNKFDRQPTLLLDLGCGTGNFSYAFAEKGIEVIGVDPSVEMLSIAAAKPTSETPPVFLCQKAKDLELFGTVDGVVSCLDSINHIVDVDELFQSFAKVSLFLEPERLFIFDVNTIYKHKKVLSRKKFLYEDGNKICIWKNGRCKRDGSIKMKLELIEQYEDGYLRYTDTNCERAYSVEQLKALLSNAGFEVLAIYDDLTEQEQNPCSERLYFVAKKVK